MLGLYPILHIFTTYHEILKGKVFAKFGCTMALAV